MNYLDPTTVEQAKGWIDELEQMATEAENIGDPGLADEHRDRVLELESWIEDHRPVKPKLTKQQSLKGELSQAKGRAAQLRAEAAAETDVSQKAAKLLEAVSLEERVGKLEQRVDFVGATSEAISLTAEDARVRVQELEREAENWPRNTPKRKQIEGQALEARKEIIRLEREVATRVTHDRAREGLAIGAQKEAARAAAVEWKATKEAELKQLTAHISGHVPGLQLGDPSKFPAQWEIDRARAELNSPPPADLVAKHRQRIDAAQAEKFAHLSEF